MTNIITKEIKIPASSDGAFSAYIAMPEDASAENQKPALIVIQEIFGINAEMREKCEEFARQGYIAICPDLFWRIEPGIELVDSIPEQLERAFQLYQDFDFERGMQDLETAVGYAKNWDICSQKVGAIGYCLGGHLSYRLATRANLNAAVSYYGVQIEEYLDEMDRIEEPMLFHIASEDEFVNKDAQAEILKAVESRPHLEAHVYEGQNHAVARGKGTHYNEGAASLANTRTAEFLKKNLS